MLFQGTQHCLPVGAGNEEKRLRKTLDRGSSRVDRSRELKSRGPRPRPPPLFSPESGGRGPAPVDIGGPIGPDRCFHSPFSLSPVGCWSGWATTVPSLAHHQPGCPGTGCGLGSVGATNAFLTQSVASCPGFPVEITCPLLSPGGVIAFLGPSWGAILIEGDTPRWANPTFSRKTVGAS